MCACACACVLASALHHTGGPLDVFFAGNVLVGPRGAKKISMLRLIDFEYSDYNPCG